MKKTDDKPNVDYKPWVTDSKEEHIRQGRWLDSWRGILISGSLYLLFCLLPLWYFIGFVFKLSAEIFSIPLVESWLPFAQPISFLIAIIFGPFFVAASRYVDKISFWLYEEDPGTLYGYLVDKKSNLIRMLSLGLLLWFFMWLIWRFVN